MQGFAAGPVNVKGEVFAYVGLPQNLKDLKGRQYLRVGEVQLHLGDRLRLEAFQLPLTGSAGETKSCCFI